MSKQLDPDIQNTDKEALATAFASLSKVEDVLAFLDDVCTPAELIAISDRWKVSRLLEAKVSYRRIAEVTGVSTATVTRVARAITLWTRRLQHSLNQNQTQTSRGDK